MRQIIWIPVKKYFEAKYQQISQHSASLGSGGCVVFDVLNLIDFISK